MSNEKALVLIDYSNVYYGFREQRWLLGYQKFLQWIGQEFNIIDVLWFSGILGKKAFQEKYPNKTLTDFIQYKKNEKALFKKLRAIGYKVRSKPVASIYDRTSGTYKRKCNFDVEIAIAALDKIDEYHELVLVSGDGDFLKLVKYMKAHYKKVTVIAHKHRLNGDLKNVK